MSDDPAIRHLEQRRAAVQAELHRLHAGLTDYANRVRTPEVRPMIAPIEHYSMLDAPDCGCPTCMDWEGRRAEFVAAVELVPKGHKWTVCACTACRFVGRIQLNYLAATNRRDLLIEVSYHAQHHSTHPNVVMAWLAQEMRRPEYTVNWCAQEMSRFPLERWLKRCEAAVSGQVSGAVFCDSAMRTSFFTPGTSSLLAETSGSFSSYDPA